MKGVIATCHHTKLLNIINYTSYVVFFIPVSYLFYNWKFIPIIPFLFLSKIFLNALFSQVVVWMFLSWRTVLWHLLRIINCHSQKAATLSVVVPEHVMVCLFVCEFLEFPCHRSSKTVCGTLVKPIIKCLPNQLSCLCFLRCYGKKGIEEGLSSWDVNLYQNRHCQEMFSWNSDKAQRRAFNQLLII